MKILEKPKPVKAGHKVVSREEWVKARKAHLKREKALTHQHETLMKERRALPWTKVDKNYTFDTPEGKKSLSDLFGNNSQLIVYHFMFAPSWDAGCPHCTFLGDHIQAVDQHLKNHDVTMTAVSRAPLTKLEAYKKRLGWNFPWASSGGTDFNFDFHVSFPAEDLAKKKVYYNYETGPWYDSEDLPGASVFTKDKAGNIYHTYSTYTRGLDVLIGAHQWLDLTPKGRNETHPMSWVRRHDEYGKED